MCSDKVSPPHASGYSRAYASRCAQCGAILDRDCNAALNILNAAGLAEPLNTHGDDIRCNPAVDGACTHQRSADPTGGAMHSAPGLPVL